MSSPDSKEISKSTPAPQAPAAKGKKAERSTEQNLMLAFALAAVVMLGTQYFLPQPAAPAPNKAAQTVGPKDGTPATQAEAPPSAAALTPGTAAPAAGRIAASSEQTQTIETDFYRVVFSNKGAVVRSWVLKKFKDSNEKPLNLVHTKLGDKVLSPFALDGTDSKPLPAVSDALYAATLTPDKLGIDFEFSDGTNYAKKTFRFAQAKYTFEFASTVTERGIPKQHFVAWRGGFGDGTVIGAASKQQAVFYDANRPATLLGLIPTGMGVLVLKTASDASTGPQANRGAYTFAGLNDTYFAAVALPEASSDFRLTAVADTLPDLLDGKETPHVGALLGGETSNKLTMFVGPKDVDLMGTISPRLATLIDWGTWFGWAAKPLFTVLHYVNDGFIHNWGWSIVIITILINLVTLPFKYTGLKSARKMQVVQPELKLLQDKYKGMAMSDPRRGKQNEEMMALYARHGVSPVSGCIPNMLILPVAIAFYNALSAAIELRGAGWLWVTDLSRPETIAIHMLPVLMLITQLLTMKMMPQPGSDPTQQKMMMLMMPMMLVFFMYNQSSGLVLYWLTSNIVGIAQQMIFNRFSPAPVLPAPPTKSLAKKK